MTMESEMERNFRGGFMEFLPKESCFSLMADQQGDSSSAEDMDSPRSPAARNSGVRRWTRWRKVTEDRKERCYLHSQILRIKEEELQIGADFFGDYGFDSLVPNSHPFDDHALIWSRTILPASPLSGKRIGRNH
uniref:Uncharacterized protein n=1 Tax=Opuntia streptacantha TaxID=393608 RepID=A0A7C8ZWG7_OPUST